MNAMLKLAPSTEPAACSKCSKHFMREVGSDERLCFDCDPPGDYVASIAPMLPVPPPPTEPEPVASSKPAKCPCGVRESHEGLCAYRVKHLVPGLREQLRDEAIDTVRKMVENGYFNGSETSDIFRAAVLLILGYKWSRNHTVLRHLTGYPDVFIFQVNQRLRRNGVWTYHGTEAEWPSDKEGSDMAFLLDVMVAVGDIERVQTPEGLKYKAKHV